MLDSSIKYVSLASRLDRYELNTTFCILHESKSPGTNLSFLYELVLYHNSSNKGAALNSFN